MFVIALYFRRERQWKKHLAVQKNSKRCVRKSEYQLSCLSTDQFTLETQKTLVSLNGNKGILNIDVLSFHRLAYRAFEEVPALRRTVLEDMGKIMILYQVFSKKKKEMLYFKRGLNAAGIFG